MPSWRHYARALYVFQMSWHCAPLKSEGAFSLSGNPMRGKPQSVSNQKGSSSCLQSENCWSQSPICWPMVTVSNLSTRTNNRWLAYQPVIIARWYISQCHAMISTLFTSQLIQYLHHKLWYFPSTTVQFLNPNVWYFQYNSLFNTPVQVPNIYNFTTNSITFHRITYQNCCQSTTPKYIPLFQENHNHQTGYYIYNVWSFFISK